MTVHDTAAVSIIWDLWSHGKMIVKDDAALYKVTKRTGLTSTNTQMKLLMKVLGTLY